MGIRVRDVLMRELDQLRYEPSGKRIRARLGDVTVIDSTRAMLVWEPRRVVPFYAVAEEDVAGEIGAAHAAGGQRAGIPAAHAQMAGVRVLVPSDAFAIHTTEGEPVTIRAGGRAAAAFRPADPALAGYVIVDFHVDGTRLERPVTPWSRP